ncbi:hypothetical protein HBB16_13970 [Pseudonocardia sp. MCCB 268]|nr:hypothetical protein [Pseudonocardia cytotoxica]
MPFRSWLADCRPRRRRRRRLGPGRPRSPRFRAPAAPHRALGAFGGALPVEVPVTLVAFDLLIDDGHFAG